MKPFPNRQHVCVGLIIAVLVAVMASVLVLVRSAQSGPGLNTELESFADHLGAIRGMDLGGIDQAGYNPNDFPVLWYYPTDGARRPPRNISELESGNTSLVFTAVANSWDKSCATPEERERYLEISAEPGAFTDIFDCTPWPFEGKYENHSAFAKAKVSFDGQTYCAEFELGDPGKLLSTPTHARAHPSWILIVAFLTPIDADGVSMLRGEATNRPC